MTDYAKKSKSENKKEMGSYDEDHPYYLKYCSMSRIHPKKKYGKPGGTPGHAALYIKGACLQTQKGPSRLKICEENEDFSNPDLGVGISTNKYLENVNFVSVPGQKMFFGTGLLVDEKFTWEAKEKIKRGCVNRLSKTDGSRPSYDKTTNAQNYFFEVSSNAFLVFSLDFPWGFLGFP